jgi:hypothetical protein
MSDATLIAILLIFFALAIALVRVLGALIEGDGDPGEFPDDLPDSDGPSDPSGASREFLGKKIRATQMKR